LRIKRIIRYWSPVAFQAGVIFYLSSIPQDDLPHIEFFMLDKIVHFFLYLALGLFIVRLLVNFTQWRHRRRIVWIAIAIASFYGIADEFHQIFTPGRGVEFGDFLADCIGATVGAHLIDVYLKLRKKWTTRQNLPDRAARGNISRG